MYPKRCSDFSFFIDSITFADVRSAFVVLPGCCLICRRFINRRNYLISGHFFICITRSIVRRRKFAPKPGRTRVVLSFWPSVNVNITFVVCELKLCKRYARKKKIERDQIPKSSYQFSCIVCSERKKEESTPVRGLRVAGGKIP